jgi:hypothetical protein
VGSEIINESSSVFKFAVPDFSFGKMHARMRGRRML